MRAIAVLVVFVAVTALVLSDVHPTAGTAAASASTATTATTAASGAGQGSTTTTTAASHSKSKHPTTTTTTIPPSKVAVVVANASGVTGAAAAISAGLTADGWNLLPPVNAATDVATSTVYYIAGFRPQAASIAKSLHLAATAVAPYTTAAPVSTIGTADVVVVAGPDVTTTTTTTTTTTG